MDPYFIGEELRLDKVPLIPNPTNILVQDDRGVISKGGIDSVVKKDSNSLITSGAVHKAILDGIAQTIIGESSAEIPTPPPGGEVTDQDIYDWSLANVSQSTGITLTFDGTGYSVRNDIVSL